MIEYIKKDITTTTCGIVLHGCNTKGVMGSGVAKAIRAKWPKAYETYKSLCDSSVSSELMGKVQYVVIGTDLIVANGFTQLSFGSDGRKYADIDAVHRCVLSTLRECHSTKLPLYMPPIGCGLGGLSWDNDIRPVVEQAACLFPEVQVYVCDI